MNNFIKERNEAFSDAVLKDEWKKLKKYAKKYDVSLPKNKKAMKVGVYKAVQYCTNIPEDVKVTAIVRCLELGCNPFIPFIEPVEREENANEEKRSN